MKELVVISGKGGTGKTTILASFCSLAKNPVIADCDVDAANMHLLLDSKERYRSDFFGSKKAFIDVNKCTQCKECKIHCRFNAISDDIIVNTRSCEGCGVCEYVCKDDAIILKEVLSAYLCCSDTPYGPMAHTSLFPGEEGSGKLVTFVRELAHDVASKEGRDTILVDGPPGIGCPVIATVTGASLAVIVTEPSLSGLHDLTRAIGLCDKLNVPVAVCINKYDVNLEIAEKIQSVCMENSIPLVGEIPYHTDVINSVVNGEVLTSYCSSEPAIAVRSAWKKVNELLHADV